MKIHAITVLLILGLMMGCGKSQKDRFEVDGAISHNPGKQTVYLDAIDLNGTTPITLDTAVISGDNASFVLKGLANYEGIFRLRFEKDNYFALLVNDKSPVEFKADWKDFGNYTVNSGGSNSFRNLLRQFNLRLLAIDSLRNEVSKYRYAATTDTSRIAAEEGFRSFVSGTVDYLIQYADTTKSVGVALYAYGMIRDQVEPVRLQPLINTLAQKYPAHPEIQKIVADFNTLMQQEEAKNLIGKPAPEINLPDTAGNNLSLSSLKGKYVLVDFWASWCAPCRAENPNVVSAYERFKDKNFTILGVSLDRDKRSWLGAIEEDKLYWNQVSDLKFWSSVVVEPYHIEGIPFNVLVDPGGRIIASNLRGSQLHQKLRQVLP